MAVTEQRKIAIRATLEEFSADPNSHEYEFPISLTKAERELIHKQCRQLGLLSKSRGSDNRRQLTVYHRRKVNIIGEDGVREIPEIRLDGSGVADGIRDFLHSQPLVEAERELLVNGKGDHRVSALSRHRLLPNDPGIPPPGDVIRVHRNVIEVRNRLPIRECRGEFLRKLRSSQVLLIIGETGSGKSTQIPQFILEDASATSTACRVIVAEPRRLAAVSLAERVAVERGECVGDVVGYQIRLDSRHSSNTLLTYCTNGVLLQAAISQSSFFDSVTHLIIDEAHERDKYTDFLLIILRDILPSFPSLKLIIMSACLERDLLGNYFHCYSLLDVPGRCYSVETYFLDDILFMVNYRELLAKKQPNSAVNIASDASSVEFLDRLLESVWINGCADDCEQWQHIWENIPSTQVNYQHRITGASLLMITAGLGQLDAVNFLLDHGADPLLISSNGWQALHWAAAFGKEECVSRLSPITNYQQVIDSYHSLVDDDRVDVELIVELLSYICEYLPDGAVLIFLPGYDDMLRVKQAISGDRRLGDEGLFLCLLHSQVHSYEHRRAFNPAPEGMRKIVLSTNVAEVSITIEDIHYVIDTGKMKQRVYDTSNDVSALSTVWIAKANVIQRAGRAGRCQNGICFCLYTDFRFSAMPDKPTPEILRAPIHELCLQTKLLNGNVDSVADFLKRAPEPPSTELIYSSVRLLKAIGAFDVEERLTLLGRCLAELAIDPQLGKMIVYGTVLRCLDPILTLVALLSYQDPFVLPGERDHSDVVAQRRYELGQRTPYSDHGVLIGAFLQWNAKRQGGRERFVSQNFLSSGAMEKAAGVKRLLFRALNSLGFGRDFTSEGEFHHHFNSNSYWPVVKAALTAGAYPNVAFADPISGKLLTEKEKSILNVSSVLRYSRHGNMVKKDSMNRALGQLPSHWIVFNELCRRKGTTQVQCATMVTSTTIALFAGPLDTSMTNVTTRHMLNTGPQTLDSIADSDQERRVTSSDRVSILRIDDWLKVRMKKKVAEILIPFRQKLHAYFVRQLMDPAQKQSVEEKKLMALSIQLLLDAELEINPGYKPYSLFQ